MRTTYLFFLFSILFFTGCENEQETPAERHNLSGISWMTYDETNSGLHDNFITNVEIDKNDSVWIGTFANGIGRFNQTNWTVYTTRNSGLSCDSIWDMAFDLQNNLWIGTKNGLNKFDGTNWTVYTKDNAPLPINFIGALAVDKDNVLWFGCGNATEGGLMRFDGTNWELFTPENSDLPCSIITDIYVDKDNNKWIGTGQWLGKGGIVKINGNQWTVFTKENTPIPYNHADHITQDASGAIWVAQTAMMYDVIGYFDGSLLKYDGVTWTVIKPHDYMPSLTNRVECLKADKYNNIWITTTIESGPPVEKHEIAMFNGTNWTNLRDIDSTVYNSYVMDMEFDKNNALWIGHTGYGLTKMQVAFEK